MNPIQIKGQISFVIEGRKLEFKNQNLSTYGVAGLPWGPLDSNKHFGKKVDCSISVASPKFSKTSGVIEPGETLSFITEGHITREYTLYSSHMGVRFNLPPHLFEKLQERIKTFGSYPTEYIRQYPRIPSLNVLQTFPLRAFAYDPAHTSPDPIIFDVGNLSPNGVLLLTESLLADSLKPGAKIAITLEPRGWFPTQIHTLGLICRIADETNLESGNVLRRLGIKLFGMDEANQAAFRTLIRDIVQQVKPA